MSFFSLSAKAKEVVEDAEKELKYEPTFVAGSSVTELADLSEESMLEAAQKWSQCDASTFNLRIGPNYKSTGAKAPSPNELYDLVGIDFLQSKKRIQHIGKKVIFPPEWTEGYVSSDAGSGDDAVEFRDVKTTHIPTLLIVNTQFPRDFSTSMFGESKKDGEGWNLVHYFRVKKSTLAELENFETASNAVKLFAKYCREAPESFKQSSSTWHGRFKLMSRCENIDEFGLPGFITSYNAKPCLIRNTLSMYHGETDHSYLEVDVNVHEFGSLPKKALGILMDKFNAMRVSTGFCIESRDDEEMPETLLGVSTTYKPDYEKAVHWDEVNTGETKK